MSFDYFGPPSVELFYDGHTHFQTALGAICTIVVYGGSLLLFIYMVLLFDYPSQDIVFSSSDIANTYNQPGEGISILDEDKKPYLDSRISILDANYDNDDNPYG